jgi:hypothetical protein
MVLSFRSDAAFSAGRRIFDESFGKPIRAVDVINDNGRLRRRGVPPTTIATVEISFDRGDR